MAFGDFATLRDDFNRANQGHPMTGWAAWISSGLQVISNQCRPVDVGDNGSYFNTAMTGSDVEAYVTIGWYPIMGGQILIACRLDPAAGGDGTCYYTEFDPYLEFGLTSAGTPTYSGSGYCTMDTGDVVTAPTSLVSATQGWVAARVKPFWASTSGPTLARIFDCGGFSGYYDSPNGRWTLDNGAGGVATLTNAHNANDLLTVIFAWTASTLKISVNGGAFTSVSRSSTGSVTDFSFGNRASDAARPFNGDFYWVLSGEGTLSDADAATIHGNGNTDPNIGGGMTTPGLPKLLWRADNANYGSPIMKLVKIVAGTYTELGSWTKTMLTNDKIGIRCTGTTIEAWVNRSGTWTMIGNATDSAVTGTGNQNKIGLYEYGNGDAGMAFDDLFAGTISIAYSETATIPLKFTPSGADVEAAVETGTTRLSFTPSATETLSGQYLDATTARVSFTPSGFEFLGQLGIDAGTIPLALTPSSVESYATAAIPPVLPPGPVIVIPGPSPEKSYWTVIHYRHDGTALGDEFPVNPEFAMYLGGKVGYCNYDLDRSSPLAVKDNCEPYATDYALFFGGKKIQAGFHTDILTTDLEEHTFQVNCKDWLHWFEKQQWYFDPTNPLANVYTAAGKDIFTIFEELLTNIQSYPDTLQFTFANGTAGVTTNFKIDVNDTSDMLSKFNQLAEATPAFEFEVTPDRQIKLYYPKKTRINDNVLEIGANVYQLNYHNKGPNATQVLVTGQAPSSQVGGVYVDTTARSKYRRWMANQDIGQIADAAALNAKTPDILDHYSTPSLEFTCTIIPDFVEDFFSNFLIGDSIHVHGDIGWAPDVHELAEPYFRLVSIVGKINENGDQEYELGFDDGSISL